MKSISEEKIKIMLSKSRKSSLWKFSNEIKELRSSGVSFIEIKTWLEAEGVSTSVQNIRQFYVRNLQNRDLDEQKQKKSEKNISVDTVFKHLLEKG